MDKYIGTLLSEQRVDTRNGDTSAISDTTLIRYNDYAQKYLFGLITKSHPRCFIEYEDLPVTGNENIYQVTGNLAFGTRIVLVKYSYNGEEKHFRRLTPYNNLYSAYTPYPGRPRYYERRHGKVVLIPTPEVTEGTLRIFYEKALDSLALRVARVNGTPSGAVIDLTHSSFGAPSADTETALAIPGDFICLSKPDGTVVLYNGVISSYNAGSDALTLAANVSTYLVSGYALADLADCYLTLGKWTTTHSKLPNEAEQFCTEYVNRCIHNIESSKQWATTDKVLSQLAATVLANFASPDKDIKSFPMDDFDLLIPGYD